MSQYKIMLKDLKAGKTLTRLICMQKYGILESPARVSEMRANKIDVKTKMVPAINRNGRRVWVAHWTLEAKAVA